MLINERRPLGTNVQLESDLLERALETGVIVEYQPAIDEKHVDRMLGGLIKAEEYIRTREAHRLLTSPTSAPDKAKVRRRSPYVPRRSGGRGRPK